MQTPEEFAWEVLASDDFVLTPHEVLTDLIRARDAEVRADERAKVLAGFTEERADRMVPRRVPCDCPGDWQHHARLVGDDGPVTHATFEAVPSRRLVSPWEVIPDVPEA